MKKAIITQSNYIPWKGFFDSLKNVDVFVVYDEMQFTKRDWRNRNLIKTPQGLKWLTIPVEVKGKYFQKISETKIADKNWNVSHWNIIKQNYSSAPYFKELSDWLEPLFLNCRFEYLTEVNLYFINEICRFFDLKVEIRQSSEFNLADEKTQRLVDICTSLDVTDYYSGPAARSYMDELKFSEKGIKVHYWDYSKYPVYDQIHPPFEHGVTIIDLILNQGKNSFNYF
jgi:hypothetical protein